ncbi:DinB family protein [Jatrophihabitans sp. YIM 134969]
MTAPDGPRTRFDELLDEYRAALLASLDDLTEEEARARLVPSKTTLLGLVKHVTFVEAVWFAHAVDGRTLRDLGVASTPDRSFTLRRADTIETVRVAYRDRLEDSRRTTAALALDDVVEGGRGERTVWALYLQVLRELAQHAGHADILREQTLAARPG